MTPTTPSFHGPPPAYPPLNPPPPRVPDHELTRVIGRGAYGEVWLGRNLMGTWRAIKVVRRTDFDSDRPLQREFKGIRAYEPLSRSHEGLVDILQLGANDAEGCFYYVMELADDASAPVAADVSPRQLGTPEPAAADPSVAADVSPRQFAATQSAPTDVGGHDSTTYQPLTLSAALKRRGRLPFAECLRIAVPLADALRHLHSHSLVHRDIKPSNIIFVNGIPKLADIGLVVETGEARSIAGTEGFILPEGPGAPPADLYSLGKTLYEISTGFDRLRFPEPRADLGNDPEREDLCWNSTPSSSRRVKTTPPTVTAPPTNSTKTLCCCKAANPFAACAPLKGGSK